jgi:type II secretory pathway pseudopilin PulG
MAALLVAMAVMAILMTAAMPAWRQIARREKEAELIFRGQQYAHAIGLFQRRSGPGTLPPSIDVLVDQKFLRKAFKDPVTGEDFDLLRVTPNAPGQPMGQPAGQPQGRAGVPAQPTTGRGAPSDSLPGAGVTPTSASARGATGGIMGVASKSKEESLRVYNGRTHYNEWQFMFVAQTQAAGGPANTTGPGGRAGAPNAPIGAPPGGRGQPAPIQRGGPGMPSPMGTPGSSPINRGRM